MKSREKLYLDEDDEGMEVSEDELENAVMDLPSEEEEEFENGSEDSEFDSEPASDEASEMEDEDEAWGKSKKAFYSADGSKDDVADEAVEAKKMQKKKLSQLELADFVASTDTKKKKPAKLAAQKVIKLEVSSDEDQSEGEQEDLYADEAEVSNMTGDDLIDVLPEDEKLELLQRHEPEMRTFVTEFKKKVTEILKSVEPALEALKSTPSDKGLSFLQTKYQLLLGYCANIAFYLSLKVKGKSVDKHPVVERLVKYRLLIEKIKPMEAKFQYQIDKLLHASNASNANSTGMGSEKELAFKPNLNFVDKESGSDEEEEASGVYKAPKIAPVHFADSKNKTDKLEERQKLLASKSRLMADIQADMEDRPEEELIDPVYGKSHSTGMAKHRDAYEEDNFMRFNLSKKEQRKLEKLEKKPIDELEDLNDFFRDNDKGNKKASKLKGTGALTQLMGIKDSSVAKPANIGKDTKKRNSKSKDEDSELSDIEDDMGEDDFYKDAKKKKFNKASSGSGNKPVSYKPLSTVGADGSRPASYEMIKNKGLTPHRPKDVRNPRVHHRMKWEKAQKKIKSFKAVASTPKSGYSGESSGIRTNISRSVKF